MVIKFTADAVSDKLMHEIGLFKYSDKALDREGYNITESNTLFTSLVAHCINVNGCSRIITPEHLLNAINNGFEGNRVYK